MSQLKVNTIRHTGASSDAITLASDGTCTAKITNYPRHNLLINGAFSISQRQGTTGGNPSNNDYWIDRWKAGLSQSAKYGLQQKTSTPASGFKEYLSIASNSAYTLTTNDHFFIEQCIEGVNAAPLDYGLATAKTSTLSFWVRSTLTGTFGGAFSNSAGDRSYVFAYTISSANTWEKKSITIAGDTSGTWLRTTGIGLKVRFNLGVNGTWSATAGSWGAGNKAGDASQVALVATNNAELLLTGVKLEIGDTATEFVTSYGAELASCQRYYEQVYGGYKGRIEGDSDHDYDFAIMYKATKRADPTLTLLSSEENIFSSVTVSNASLSSRKESCILRGNNVVGGGGNLKYVFGRIAVDAEL